MKKLVILLSLQFVIFALSYGEYQIGDHVEDFELPDSQGNRVSLYDYADRIVIMPWWQSD